MDRAEKGFPMPFRHDAYMPFTAVDLRVLRALGLPLPAELDDSADMLAQAREAARAVTQACAERVEQHEREFEARSRTLDHQEIAPAA